MARFTAAEEFFWALDIPYDRHVLDVNRLHILKRFRQYLSQHSGWETLPEGELLPLCRAALARAHDDFVHSSALQERVFKVFHEARGQQHIPLQRLHATLPSRR
ncbi:nitrogenase-stabilizing/protective protein NifW [Tepidiphilus baoligensis]|nr:nitrogenase-stabilizing/protective protein NifW [Tepidiphilus baoligensis]